jgi:putative transposase
LGAHLLTFLAILELVVISSIAYQTKVKKKMATTAQHGRKQSHHGCGQNQPITSVVMMLMLSVQRTQVFIKIAGWKPRALARLFWLVWVLTCSNILRNLRKLKLTVQIKLLPDAGQAKALRETLETANGACNRLSELAWQAKEFRRFPLHKRFYAQIRREFPLSAQVVCLLNGKVADGYKLDRERQRLFRKHGSISYDARILAINLPASTVSIWTLPGRQKMPFVCGERQRTLLAYPRGEADLILRDLKWFLNVTVEVPEERENEAVDVLGVDFGIAQIAYDSDGNNYTGSAVNRVRNRNRSLRCKLQKKGTKSAKRLLRKRRRKEARFCRNENHIVSKRIVQTAKRTNRAIAIENLDGIRQRIRARKPERTRLHSWAFAELGALIGYKAQMAGVRVIRVDPRNTSRRCNQCGHTEKANRKSQSEFLCKACGHAGNADANGSLNIRLKGLEILGTAPIKVPYIGTTGAHVGLSEGVLTNSGL